MANIGHAVNPSLYRSLPFDPVSDFSPIILVATQPSLPVANLSFPAKSVRELIALGITTAKRSPAAPDIPTIAEQGLDGYESNGWNGLLAPAAIAASKKVMLDTLAVAWRQTRAARQPHWPSRVGRAALRKARRMDDGMHKTKLAECFSSPEGDVLFVAAKDTIAGEKLNVGAIRLAASPKERARCCPHEQFFMVLEGELRAEIDGQELLVPPHSGLHVPAGTPHKVSAGTTDGTLCVLVEGNGRQNRA